MLQNMDRHDAEGSYKARTKQVKYTQGSCIMYDAIKTIAENTLLATICIQSAHTRIQQALSLAIPVFSLWN